MIKYSKLIPILLLVLAVTFNSCSNENNSFDENQSELSSQIIYQKSDDGNYQTNSPLFPDIDIVRSINENAPELIDLKEFIELVGSYNVNFSKVEVIHMTTYTDAKMYSIPFINDVKKKLLVFQEDDKAKILIANESMLENGHLHYSIHNFENKLLYEVEQNNENQIGNQRVIDNDNGFFLYNFDNQNTENFVLKDGSCLRHNNFSRCMQCAADKCADSWVCVAVLAIRPLETIGFAVAMCGLNTIANLK
jgi:hypothetical protein